MPILRDLHGPADLRGLTEAQLAQLAAEIRETIIATVADDRRPPRLVARRRRADDRAPPAARVAARPDRLGHRPPGLPAQAADRPARAVRHAPPARRRRRLPAAHRVARTTCSTAATPAPACRSPRASPRRATCATALERIAVVVGDAALMSGLSLEALNDIGQRQTPDADRAQRQRDVDQPDGRRVLEVPVADQAVADAGARARAPTTGPSSASRSSGRTVLELVARLRKSVVNFAQPGQLFEDLGITYIGVVPGPRPARAARDARPRARRCPGPTIVHVRTQKGRGYRPAETDQVGFHGAALPPMTAQPGRRRLRRRRRHATPAADADRVDGRRRRPAGGPCRGAEPKAPNYTAVFAGGADRAGADGPADRRRSPPACRPAPACRSSRPSSRTASSTSASPSSTR